MKKLLIAACAVCCVMVAGAAKPTAKAVQEPTECVAQAKMDSRNATPGRGDGPFGDYWWANRFLSRIEQVRAVKGQTVDVVLMGDSIMHFWEWRHPQSWAKFTAGRKVLNCGYGGYCLPKDTNALYAVARTAGFDAQILKNVIHTNDSMPAFMAGKIIRAAGNDTDKTIGVLGLSFKPGSDDVRDTPSAKIIAQLMAKGYRHIVGYDPVASEEFKRHYGYDITYAPTYDALVNQADVLAITTAWPEFKDIQQKTDKPIVDCRYML